MPLKPPVILTILAARNEDMADMQISNKTLLKTQAYINGAWVDPVTPKTLDVINPATETVAGRISMGSAADVDKAVKAARAAFETWSQSSIEERIALFERLIEEYKKRYADMAAAITEEMGAPAVLSQKAQAAMGIGHLQSALGVLKNYHFTEQRGTTMIVTNSDNPIAPLMASAISLKSCPASSRISRTGKNTARLHSADTTTASQTSFVPLMDAVQGLSPCW